MSSLTASVQLKRSHLMLFLGVLVLATALALGLTGEAQAASNVNPNPPTEAPPSVRALSDNFLTVALLVCVGGILISATLWALGSKGQNPGTELAGKKGLIVCVTAAFLLGALPAWVSYLRGLAEEGDTKGNLRAPVVAPPAGGPVPGQSGPQTVVTQPLNPSP